MSSSSALVDDVVSVARDAGDAIEEIYRGASDPEIVRKADDSPLTAADLASHRIIVSGLGALTPDIPVLSEEGAERSYEVRRRWQRFWLVDPLDGTKEFIRRNGEFTVNIALVENGAPVLGVVYAPMLQRTYSGVLGEGAWRRDGDGEAVAVSAMGTQERQLAVVASRSHPGPVLESFLSHLPAHRLVSMGSSLKLCLVAEGVADVYPRLGPTMEWDTAAAHAVVAAAGGEVMDFEARPLRYNKENLLNPHFIVLGQRSIPWREAFAAASSG